MPYIEAFMFPNFSLFRIVLPTVLLFSLLPAPRLNAGDESNDPSAVFRGIFYRLAEDSYDYKPEDVEKLIFAPHEDFLRERKLKQEAEAAFDARSEDWKSIRPSELYEKGKTEPVLKVEDPDQALDEAVITIVIIPGIFGEFINHHPFHEVLSQKESHFAKRWQEALDAKPTRDKVFDLEAMDEVEKSLDELTVVASLDSPAGEDRIRLIYLKPLLGSLETLGTLEDSSRVYLRRLNKIRSVLGTFENLYIMGYSRGLNVALDMLSRAEPEAEKHPWFGEMKGVLSLGGTLYGSALADAAFTPGKVTCAALERLNRLAKELVTLKPSANLGEQIEAVAKNAAAWAAAGSDLLALGAEMKPAEGLLIEQPDTDSLNMGAFGELLRTVIFEKFKITEGSEYNGNVEKFQRLMREITEGIDSITLKKSLAWQKSHTIPARFPYFVIQGTMGDPSSEEKGASELAKDSVSFNTKAIDYSALRKSYYDYFLDTGAALNDSQVSPDRTVFWPALHRKLNPGQEPYEAHLLVQLGVDHWGMSFPVALETRNEEVSPFPRTLLLHTLGAYLAQDLKGE